MNKDKLIELKRRLIALSLVGIMLSTNGCTKNEKNSGAIPNESKTTNNIEIAPESETPSTGSVEYYREKNDSETPKNLFIDENRIASWDVVKGSNSYKLLLEFSINGHTYNYDTLHLKGEEKDGRIYYDLNAEILRGCEIFNLFGQEFSFSFKALSHKSLGKDSDYSVASNTIPYKSEYPKVLSTPTNLKLDENYIASWDVVNESDCYKIMIKYTIGEESYTTETLNIRGEIIDGRVYYDLTEDIAEGYDYYDLYNQNVIVSFRVRSKIYYSNPKNLVASPYSSYSDEPLKTLSNHDNQNELKDQSKKLVLTL